MSKSTDRIEKETILKAPRARVFRALTDAREFGEWFGVKIEGAFTPGATVHGQLTIKGYEHLEMELLIEKIEPEHLFSFRWHPYAIDPAVDYSVEPHTLVTFELAEAPGGTKLTVTETGFDRIPGARRIRAFEMNASGWTQQMGSIEKYLRDAS